MNIALQYVVVGGVIIHHDASATAAIDIIIILIASILDQWGISTIFVKSKHIRVLGW